MRVQSLAEAGTRGSSIPCRSRDMWEFNGSSIGIQWEFNGNSMSCGPNACNLSLLLQGGAMGNRGSMRIQSLAEAGTRGSSIPCRSRDRWEFKLICKWILKKKL